MLKAVLTHETGKQTLCLGLERRNVERLQGGEPVHFEGAELGLEGWSVLIFAGEDSDDLQDQLFKAGLPIK